MSPSDQPDDMLTRDKPIVNSFSPQEKLFRRFSPSHLDGNKIDIAAIKLPDISTNRESVNGVKIRGSAEWLIKEENFSDWGVAAFPVEAIPSELIANGVTKFTFKPVHDPEKHNYAHTEVRAYSEGTHVGKKNQSLLLDPNVHLTFRQRLLWKTRIVIQPKS